MAFTAHGLGVWWIVLQFLRNRGALELISEWQPPDLTNPFLVPLLLVMNFKYLPPSSRPKPLNVVMVLIGAATYASFALYTLWDKLGALLAG